MDIHNNLKMMLQNAEHPITVLIGGDKIKEQLETIECISENVDNILIAGALTAPFVKAKGLNVGNSPVCDECVSKAKDILAKSGDKICLPVDCYVADKSENDSNIEHIKIDEIPDGRFIMGIGVKTVDIFAEKIEGAKTFFWNGTLGHSEMPHFAYGTYKTALVTARGTANGLKTIVYGDDTKAAILRYGLEGGMFFLEDGKLVEKAERKVDSWIIRCFLKKLCYNIKVLKNESTGKK